MPMSNDDRPIRPQDGSAQEGRQVEALLNEAAGMRPAMRPEFMDRLLRQAEEAAALQAQKAGSALSAGTDSPFAGAAGGAVADGPIRLVQQRLGRVKRAVAALGGWPALAGMLSAALVGLWMGYAPPSALQPLLGETSELDPGALDPGEFTPDMTQILGEG